MTDVVKIGEYLFQDELTQKIFSRKFKRFQVWKKIHSMSKAERKQCLEKLIVIPIIVCSLNVF